MMTTAQSVNLVLGKFSSPLQYLFSFFAIIIVIVVIQIGRAIIVHSRGIRFRIDPLAFGLLVMDQFILFRYFV